MDQAAFFPLGDGVRISDLATLAGAELIDIRFADDVVASVAPLDRAGKGEVTFAMSRRNSNALAASRAGAVFCTKALAGLVPNGTAALVCTQPQAAFALAAVHLYPSAARPSAISGRTGISAQANIDSTAVVEDGVTIEAFAVIGPGARIGSDTVIGPGAIIGPNVRIGRNCSIGASVCLQYTLIGNDVIVHPGTRIGQDGFGYVPSARGILKIVQIGRVIIQDRVEIGANTAIDRGAIDDTVIGEGTKIDNLVQIGHNVRIGRNCFIVSQVGIAGSARIGDMVMIGGAAGINGHISVGDGAQIAAMSGVASDVPAGARWGGVPARPMRAFLRDAAEINARAFARDRDQGSDHD